jgi:hypothetical protein
VDLFVVHLLQESHYQPMYGVVERLVLDYGFPYLDRRVVVAASAYHREAYPEAFLASFVRHPLAFHPA